jgi:hypothetical protein
MDEKGGDGMTLLSSTPKRYRVFLSYKHDDNRDPDRLWANWLKNELERYQVPPELIGKPNRRREPIPPTLAPVFRDEDSLGAVSKLSTWILDGLRRSEALICLCTPRSAQSPWVRDELKRFKEMGKSDRVQALVLDGQPRASEGVGAAGGATAAEECFPKELLYGEPHNDRRTPEGYPVIDWSARAEPRWADLRPPGTRSQGFTSSGAYRQYLEDRADVPLADIAKRVADYQNRLRHVVHQLVAGVLAVDLDELTRYDVEQQAKQARREAEEAKLRAAAEAARAKREADLRTKAEIATREAETQRDAADTNAREALRQRGRARTFAICAAILAILATCLTALSLHAKRQVDRARKAEQDRGRQASLALTSEAARHAENHKWYDAVRALDIALQFDEGNLDSAQSLWALLEKQSGDRLDLPDEVICLDRVQYWRNYVANISPKRPLLQRYTNQAGVVRGGGFSLYNYMTKTWLEGERTHQPSQFSSNGSYSFPPYFANTLSILGDNSVKPSIAIPRGWKVAASGYECGELILLESQNQPGDSSLTARWWNVNTQEWHEDNLRLPTLVEFVGWSEAQARLAWKDSNGHVHIHSLEDDKEIFESDVYADERLVLSGDGKVAVGVSKIDLLGITNTQPSEVEFRSLKKVPNPASVQLGFNGSYAIFNFSSNFLGIVKISSPITQVDFESVVHVEPLNHDDEGVPVDRLLFDPMRDQLYYDLGDVLCLYHLPDAFEPTNRFVQPTVTNKPPGVAIHRFLKLAQRFDQKNVIELCSERDRLNNMLKEDEESDGNAKNFPDLPKKWRQLLRWWTARPGERKSLNYDEL